MFVRMIVGAGMGTWVGLKVTDLSGQGWLGLLIGTVIWTLIFTFATSSEVTR